MISHCAASGTRTRTAITGQGILSPSCLPIPPLRLGYRQCLSRFSSAKVLHYFDFSKHKWFFFKFLTNFVCYYALLFENNRFFFCFYIELLYLCTPKTLYILFKV